jgi:hypothetical protein
MLGAKLRYLNRLNEALAQLDPAAEELNKLRDQGFRDAELRLAPVFLNRAQVFGALDRWPDATRDSDEATSIYRKFIAGGRPQLQGCLAHILIVRAKCRHMSGDFVAAATDRGEGFTLVWKLMREWPSETDIRLAYFEQALSTVKYLLPACGEECKTHALDLIAGIEAMVYATNCSEGGRIVAGSVLRELLRLNAPLQMIGIDPLRVQQLHEKLHTILAENGVGTTAT